MANKTRDMPAKDWKKQAGLLSHLELPGAIPKEKKPPKPIAKISDRKKDRIKTEWSEWDLFKKIALDRSIDRYVIAEDIDGKKKKIALEHLQPINFAHIHAKGMNKSERMNPDNVEIVTFAVHFQEHTGQIYKGPILPN